MESVRQLVGRLRRSIAQRGVRNALGNVARRVASGNLSRTDPAETDIVVAPHPFDQATGLDTGGMIHGSALASGHAHDLYNVAYYGTAPSLFRSVLTRWKQTALYPPGDYTFVDMGAGKGRVVLLAAEEAFRECVGVEINPALCAIAEANLAHWRASGRARSPMRMACDEATSFVLPQGPCLLYLFNPFTGKVLERLLSRLAEVYRERPGELDLIYVNAEFSEQLHQHPGFEQTWEAPVEMSAEDAAVDILYTGDGAGRKEHGDYGTELCSGWRFVGAGRG